MKVLVACEESQEVCKAFRARGHNAYSCDLQECSGGHPEWHVKGDCIPLLNGNCSFYTEGGQSVQIDGKWDLIIAHPPCTYLSCAGAERTFRKGGEIFDRDRYIEGLKASVFFLRILNADCSKICLENPRIMKKKFGLPDQTQSFHPYYFGEPWYKLTCLWLKGLPDLKPTDIVSPTGYWVQRSGKRARGFSGGHRDPKMRSKTFPGIARAMAEQWG